MSVDFGTVPDWIAAIGTNAAFGIAAIVLLRERKQRARDQASAIECDLQEVDGSTTITVRNQSKRAIRNVKASVQDPIRSMVRSEIIFESPVVALLRPGRTLQVEAPTADIDEAVPTYGVFFEDSSGLRWLTHVETGEVFRLLPPWHYKWIWHRTKRLMLRPFVALANADGWRTRSAGTARPVEERIVESRRLPDAGAVVGVPARLGQTERTSDGSQAT